MAEMEPRAKEPLADGSCKSGEGSSSRGFRRSTAFPTLQACRLQKESVTVDFFI